MGWFNQKVGQLLSAMSAGHGKGFDYVQPGTTFRCVHDDELIETAEVESVAADPYGIPHVKFKLVLSRANRFTYEQGTRMLALQAFAERYSEQVPAT